MAYEGQIHQLRVEIERDWTRTQMAEAFTEAYRREYHTTLGDLPINVVNVRTTVAGIRKRERRRLAEPADLGRPEAAGRTAVAVFPFFPPASIR